VAAISPDPRILGAVIALLRRDQNEILRGSGDGARSWRSSTRPHDSQTTPSALNPADGIVRLDGWVSWLWRFKRMSY
jgi:hypothetical protein